MGDLGEDKVNCPFGDKCNSYIQGHLPMQRSTFANDSAQTLHREVVNWNHIMGCHIVECDLIQTVSTAPISI